MVFCSEMDGLYMLTFELAKANILAMRMGPGKHLHNRKLLYGAIDGHEFDFFADLIINQELVRSNARGFQDGEHGHHRFFLSLDHG